jgi:N-acetylglucosamine malate deacetylase 1
MEIKNLLAIFAHPDDELGCVGTMANFADAGHKVHLLFLTKGENASTIPGDNEERITARKQHANEVANLLNCKIHFMDFPDSAVEYTVEGAYKIADKIKEIKPHGIITWNQSTKLGAGHPDHRNTSLLVNDAISYARYRNKESPLEPHRINVTLYQYYDPEIDHGKQIIYVDVSEQYDKIMKFIEIYQKAYGNWPVKEFKHEWMNKLGRESNTKFAECFAVIIRGFSPSTIIPTSDEIKYIGPMKETS